MGIFESNKFKQFKKYFSKKCKKATLKKLFKCFKTEKIDDCYYYRLKNAEKLDKELNKIRNKYNNKTTDYSRYIDPIFTKANNNKKDGIINECIKTYSNISFSNKFKLDNIYSFYKEIEILNKEGYFDKKTYNSNRGRNEKDLKFEYIDVEVKTLKPIILEEELKELIKTALKDKIDEFLNKKINKYDEILKRIQKNSIIKDFINLKKIENDIKDLNKNTVIEKIKGPITIFTGNNHVDNVDYIKGIPYFTTKSLLYEF